MKKKVIFDGKTLAIDVERKVIMKGEEGSSKKSYKLCFQDSCAEGSLVKKRRGGFDILSIDGKRIKAKRRGEFLCVEGMNFKIENLRKGLVKKGKAQEGEMISPMPGKILKILVSLGDIIEKGTPLLLMEAMKMEHSVKASHGGKIEKIYGKEGDFVQAGVQLVEVVSLLKGDKPFSGDSQ